MSDAPKKPKKQPGVKTLEKWVMDGIAEATDGCRVEPDGHCPHGCPSWLLELGLMYAAYWHWHRRQAELAVFIVLAMLAMLGLVWVLVGVLI